MLLPTRDDVVRSILGLSQLGSRLNLRQSKEIKTTDYLWTCGYERSARWPYGPHWRVQDDPRLLPPKALPGHDLEGINIFFTGLGDDLVRKRRRLAVFVPVRRFQPVANELFVE